MAPIDREEGKRRAQAKLAAMRERARRQRRRVLSGATIAFVVLWLAIFTQMITGHDPVLGPVTATVRSAAEERVATEPRAGFSSDDRGEGDEEERGDGDDEAGDDEVAPPVAVEAAVSPVEESIPGPLESEELEAATTGQS